MGKEPEGMGTTRGYWKGGEATMIMIKNVAKIVEGKIACA